MRRLPTGTVTFLFTDIEASTRLIQHLGDAASQQVFADHRRLLCQAVEAERGMVYQDQGESFLFVFQSARDAASAAIAAQRALASHAWSQGAGPSVRMGLHTGEAAASSGEYVGLDVHRAARICQAGHGGQILLSQATRSLIEDDLPADVQLRDLGVHRLRDLQRPGKIYQLLHPDLVADFPPLASLDAVPNNLPIQLTSFIGREREIEDVKRLTASTRLVTLTGIGGSGKTRLALQVAADLLPGFRDGVWVVELASLTDPGLVAEKIAAALKLREEPSRTALTVLIEYLEVRELLLVLDNCEHLAAACDEIAQAALQAAPGVKILATSRERLSVAGAATYPVPVLSLPETNGALNIEGLMRSEAIRLFMERAGLVRPGFGMTGRNAHAVAQICDALDGIPLAIELAAARVNVLSVEQIAERLGDRFRLLKATGRGAAPHQQTLEATMEWSHNLLSNKEQALFRRLSVFAGTFTLEAIETICSGHGVETYEALDLLTRLVDKSLVMVDQQRDVAPYRLLETVRQYGEGKLLASAEAEQVHDRHLEFYVNLAEDAEPHLRGPDQERWLALLVADHDNLRAALGWSGPRAHAGETALRLAGALWWFWYTRGYYTEGRKWLDLVLSRTLDLRVPARVKALYAAAYLAWRQGDSEPADRLSQAGVSLAEEVADTVGLAFSLLVRGIVTRSRNRYAEAADLHEKSLALFRHLGHDVGIAWSLRVLGIVEMLRGNARRAAQLFEESLGLFERLGDTASILATGYALGRLAADEGDDVKAERLLAESLRRFQESNDEMGMAGAYESLGYVAVRHRDYTRARSLLDSGLALYVKLGDRWSVATVRATHGLLAAREGDCTGARNELLESLRQHMTLGNTPGIARCLEGLAEVAVAVAQPERAATLLGAAERLREVSSAPLPPADRPEHDRLVAVTRARLGEEAFGALWAQARNTTLEQSVEYAIKGT